MSRVARELPEEEGADFVANRARRRVQRRSLRKLWRNVHLYLALAVGFLFVLLGLTGSYNAFMHELEEVWHPDLVIAHPGHAFRPLAAILAAVKAAHPELPGPWTLQMPRHPSGMLIASHAFPKGEIGIHHNALLVSVNPYTAEVVASRSTRETVSSWIFDLHSALLLGGTGEKAVGILGLLLLGSLLTGLYLWWPRAGKLFRALTIKRRASRERLIFDLHKTFGVYSAVVLVVLAFSGVYLIYSDYVRPVVNVFSPVTIKGAAGVYTLRLWQPGEANRYWPSTAVYVDQYSGEVVAARDPNRYSAGETFLNVQFPLHSGEALGLPGRILVCVTGFVPLLLYVTGLMRWLQKRRGRSARRMR